MLQSDLIKLKRGEKFLYLGRTPSDPTRIWRVAFVVWTEYVVEEAGLHKDKSGKEEMKYSHHFGVYYEFEDGSPGITLRSSFPHPQRLNLSEYAPCPN